MKCEEVDIKLINYIENLLDEASRFEMEEHLNVCSKCNNELTELRAILQTISKTEMAMPSSDLRTKFQAVLQTEIEKQEASQKIISMHVPVSDTKNKWLPFIRIAASIAILIVGIIIGTKLPLKSGKEQVAQLNNLENEVKSMKEALMLNMLNEESATSRIKAVNYAEEIPGLAPKILNALINTLNTDKNVNVRLAAAYSLTKFADNQLVIDSLVKSLEKQTEPVIQIVIINLLTEKREITAITPLKKIISNKNTMKEVKQIAEKSIHVLL